VSAFGTEVSSVGLGLESLSLNNDFTPSTPYVHKFRTEMCKNFQLYGTCKYGDEVSIKNQTCSILTRPMIFLAVKELTTFIKNDEKILTINFSVIVFICSWKNPHDDQK